MKKNGFTLVELIASIAILAVLSIMITPAVIKIRNNILESTLESKINLINSSAKDYAQKHLMDIPSPVSGEYLGDKTSTKDCLTIYVRALISNGFMSGDSDDKTQLMNPITDESLNNELVCIRYNNNDAIKREIVTYIVGEEKLYEN